MDLVITNARLLDRPGEGPLDIAVAAGRSPRSAADLAAEGRRLTMPAGGWSAAG